MKVRILGWSLLVMLLFGGSAEALSAQDHSGAQEKTQEAGASAPSVYDIWLSQDVKWIITDRERSAFSRLANDEERNNFVENFWSQRDPTPDTVRNEFKDSHYRRMLTARERFSTPGDIGWNTAQGRIYVMYGPPDALQTRPGAFALGRQSAILGPACDAANEIPNSYELWHYNKIKGIDHPVTIGFATLCKNGKSAVVVDKADSDWLSRPPVPKYKLLCNGKLDPNLEPTHVQLYVCGENPPRIQFKDLEEVITSHVRYNLVAYDVQVAFDKITDVTAMLELTITIKNSDVTCSPVEDVEHAPIRIEGRFTTESKRIAHIFEDELDEDAASCSSGTRTYTQSIPLLRGSYRLNLVLQDVNGDRIGTFAKDIEVP